MNGLRLRRWQCGFSFIELMTSLAIMAVLVMMASPMTQVLIQRHREHDLRVALIEIRGALDAYKRASEQGRILLKIGQSGYPPNLNTLVEGVVDQRSPTGQKLYFLRRLPADPLFEQETINPESTWGLRSYASPPDTPSPGADVFDVYSRSDKVGLNGVPYRSW